jgi:ATP phosphoribosyltransferase
VWDGVLVNEPLQIPDGMKITLAIASGRMMTRTLDLLAQAGLPVGSLSDSRTLLHEFGPVTILEVKDPDVPVYVDLGVADAGVAGKDVILESGRDVFEPLDLGFGRCRLSLIRLSGETARIERVASKYPRTTARWLAERGLAADVVRLNGKIELAALTHLADAVVDIVETGRTLRENGLEELETIHDLSARLIVNRAALKLKADVLRPLIHRLAQLTRESG